MNMPNKEAAFELLQKMAFVRTAGSEEELKAAKLLLSHAQGLGAKAELEEFSIEEGIVHKAELEVLEPYHKSYTVTGYKCAESTGQEGLTAELVYGESLSDVNLSQVKGKIVLFNGFLRLPVYKKLVKAGAAAIISMTGSMLDKHEETDLFTRKLRDTVRKFGNMPAVNLRVEDAFELVTKKAAKAKLTLLGETVQLKSHNVIATVEGTKNPGEIISFGAHYDSTEFSTGVYDNGAGSVILMELLRYFVKNPPKRSLKFCWYGSEEIGLEGSKAFVRDHAEELKNHIFMINVDVGGPVLGYNECKVTASKELTAFTDMYMKTAGYSVDVAQGIYSSDSIPFADKGVPAINFSRNGAPGASFIHTRDDVMKYLSADGLGELLEPVFAYSKTMAEAAAFPEKREIPEEMRTEVDKYLFKKDLEELEKQEEKAQ